MGVGPQELIKIASFTPIPITYICQPFLKTFHLRRNALHIIFLSFALSGLAQTYTEVGAFGGGTNFKGDVGPTSIYPPQGWVAGLSVRQQFGAHYAVRLYGSTGTYTASDANSTWVYRRDRNQSFRSNITELGMMMEVNFLEYVTGSRRDRHSPYLFGGIGIFSFNPQGKYSDGQWYDLQPLGTEGQGTTLTNNTSPYGLSGICIPLGLGWRFSLADNVSLAIETGMRITSSDYLDDVSGYYVDPTELAAQNGAMAAYFADRSLSDTDKTGYARGQSNRNDMYFFTGIHLFIALTSKNERCSRF